MKKPIRFIFLVFFQIVSEVMTSFSGDEKYAFNLHMLNVALLIIFCSRLLENLKKEIVNSFSFRSKIEF